MKKGLIIFLVLVISVFTYISFNFYLIRELNETVLVGKLENVIEQNNKKLDLISKQFRELNQGSNASSLPFTTQFLKDLPNDNEVLFFIYENDSLVFWNANLLLPDSNSLAQLRSGSSMLQFSSGYFQGKFIDLSYETDTIRSELVLLKPIYLDYPFENQYLIDNLVSDIFPDELKVRFGKKGERTHNLQIDGEDTDFSVDFEWNYPVNRTRAFLLLSLLLTCIGVFYWLIILMCNRYLWSKHGKVFKFWILFLVVILTRIFIISFPVNHLLFQSELFDNTLVSIGFIHQSFGFLAIDVLNFCVLAFVFRSYFPTYKPAYRQLWRDLLFSIATLLLLSAYMYFVRQLIFESQAPLSFTELYNFNLYSYFIFLYISLITVSIYIIFHKLLLIFKKKEDNSWAAISLFIVLNILVGIVFYIIQLDSLVFSIFSVLFFSLVIYFFKRNQTTFYQTINTWSLLLFAALLTYLFYVENTKKSDGEQQLTALQLSMEADPMFEFVYKTVYADIHTDTIIEEMIQNREYEHYDLEEELSRYLKTNYTHSYFDKYNISVTVCDPEDELLIKPGEFLTNCQAYFKQTADEIGLKSSISPDLYYMEDNLLGTYYLSVIELNKDRKQENDISVFIEFYFKYIPEGLGYPELLIDESKGFTKLLSKYSLANYQDSVLIYKFGNYFYPSKLSMFDFDSSGVDYQNGFRHYYNESEAGKGLIVSKPQKQLIDIVAPFSYFSFLLATLGFLIIGLGFHRKQLFLDLSSFRFRLQIFSLSTLIFSFGIIGIISTVYIRGIYQEKSKDFLIERTQSILIEIEHKLRNEDINDPSLDSYLHEILIKFSQVFFSDINLYDINGNLLASSRPEIFDSKLISTKMNPEAFAAMRSGDDYLFLHQEAIGSGKFYSSYVSYRDLNGNALAFINLPYFARESEIRNEISNFILTYINIFILLSGLFAFIVLLFSRRLTKPLQMIQARMKEVRIDKTNEPIAWHREDEIGQLINQYNQLISELAKSAELLARSERETAWREMAQQVAHEIKNPLTPMRLSVQLLKRSWEEHDANLDQKIERTTKTLIEQIDTLSTIASAFSDFAKMPVSYPERLEIIDLIKRTALLYNNKTNIDIQIHTPENQAIWLLSDKNNLGRAFANLIKNAVQAIGNKPHGKIEIELKTDKNQVFISITDNGKGMSHAEQKRVFTPNFTTKSSGMGIGLSIVNQIILAANGTISFQSEEGKGTSFLITLPLENKNND